MRRLAIAVALVVASSPAFAFQRETTDDEVCVEAPNVNCAHHGSTLEWHQFPVPFVIDPGASGLATGTVIDQAEAAFATWQNASRNGITFDFAGTISSGGSDGNDGRNTIHFRPFTGGRDTFAQSILTYDVDTGELLDVDVELNDNFRFAVLPADQNDPSDPRVDLRAVLTHEVGHFLGLDHENRFGDAVVMYFSDTTGNASHRNLSSDDRSGVRSIYPEGAGGGVDDGGGDGGGCTVSPAPTGDRLALLAVLLGLALIVPRARRGHPLRRSGASPGGE